VIITFIKGTNIRKENIEELRGYMLKFEEAKKIILNNANLGLQETSVELKNSIGMVLSRDIYSNRNFPDLYKSAVDGLAVKGENLTEYKIVNTYTIVDSVDITLGDGEAVFVMTGGVVPKNADAVLRIEDCEVLANKIRFNKAFKKKENINEVGEEAAKGEVIAKANTQINEILFSVLAYAGVSKIDVFEKPKVAFFTTGDEILEIGSKYKPGYIYNTNRYIFETVVHRLGVDAYFYGNIKDNEEEISNTLKKLSKNYDIIATSGGISMGKYDFVKKILNKQNYEIIVNKTSIKPGSPLMVAKSETSVIFGLPGYPSAFLTNFFLYFIPYLKKAMKREDFDHKFVKGVLKSKMHSKKSADYFNRAVVKVEDGNFSVYSPNSQKTSHFLNFAHCSGLFRLKEGVGDVEEGFSGELLLFDLELS
jgi:molybdopterin molybdotransferase